MVVAQSSRRENTHRAVSARRLGAPRGRSRQQHDADGERRDARRGGPCPGLASTEMASTSDIIANARSSAPSDRLPRPWCARLVEVPIEHRRYQHAKRDVDDEHATPDSQRERRRPASARRPRKWPTHWPGNPAPGALGDGVDLPHDRHRCGLDRTGAEACTARKMIRASMFHAAAHRIEPTRNSATPSNRIGLRPKTSESRVDRRGNGLSQKVRREQPGELVEPPNSRR